MPGFHTIFLSVIFLIETNLSYDYPCQNEGIISISPNFIAFWRNQRGLLLNSYETVLSLLFIPALFAT